MNALLPVIKTEFRKAFRSPMFWITVIGMVFMPMMLGVLMFIKKYPELAQSSIMLSKATSIPGKGDWPAYFGIFAQMISGAGLVVYGFVASWLFGREYSDRTLKDLLALPVSRSSVVIAKFIFVALWCAFLSVILFTSGLIVGALVQLSGWSGAIVFQNAYLFMVTSLLTILLCSTVAFVASYGRGYLAPVGFAIFTLVLAQFTGVVGLGPYYPWGIPILFSTAAGAESIPLGMISYGILFLTSIAGVIGTLAWWRYADQY